MFNDNFDTYLYKEVEDYLLECGFDFLSIDHYMKPTPEARGYAKEMFNNAIVFRDNTPLIPFIKEFFSKFYKINGRRVFNLCMFETTLLFKFSKESANNIRILAKIKNN